MTKRVLVIEDTPDNRQIIRDLLVNSGYEVIEAADGGAGVAKAAEVKPDLILMDIQLPGMNGIEALKILRGDPATATIRVIAVTASVMQQDRNQITEAGFDGYIGKPLNLKEFLESVKTMLERGRR